MFGNDDDEGDDDDDDDDDILDDANLGDWRKFRASLIGSGLPSASDGAEKDEPKSVTQPTSISKENENLLEEQNPQLAKEYRSGAWAHLIAEPEVGSLICRMPIEGELYYSKPSSYWKKKLETFVNMEPAPSGDAERTSHWFQLAGRLVKVELEKITSQAKGGILNPDDLEGQSRVLLLKYLHYKQTWQEVCLVLSHSAKSSEAVVINRPVAKNVNKQLASVLLEGSEGNSLSGRYPYGFVDKFVQAFGDEAGIYLGGPNRATDPAWFLHGIADLEGAEELAPGTGIYQGGLISAVEGILEGKYQPLDFRFFIGRQVFNPAAAMDDQEAIPTTLTEFTESGMYKPVACDRSVALKQCLGLPKPLWHEGT